MDAVVRADTLMYLPCDLLVKPFVPGYARGYALQRCARPATELWDLLWQGGLAGSSSSATEIVPSPHAVFRTRPATCGAPQSRACSYLLGTDWLTWWSVWRLAAREVLAVAALPRHSTRNNARAGCGRLGV